MMIMLNSVKQINIGSIKIRQSKNLMNILKHYKFIILILYGKNKRNYHRKSLVNKGSR